MFKKMILAYFACDDRIVQEMKLMNYIYAVTYCEMKRQAYGSSLYTHYTD